MAIDDFIRVGHGSPLSTTLFPSGNGTVGVHHSLRAEGYSSVRLSARLTSDQLRERALAYLAAAERSDAIRAEWGEGE